MKKLFLPLISISLLAGCAVAHEQTAQEKSLVGDWICHTNPSPNSELPIKNIDHITFNADQTAVMRGIAKIDVKEGALRYLLQTKIKWKADKNKLSYDFYDRHFSVAHTPGVAKIVKQSREMQEFDKEFTSSCKTCGTHLDMAIKLTSPTKLAINNHYTKQVSHCRKLAQGEQTSETKLIDKLVKASQ